jgi:DNA repair protein RadC
MNETHGTTESSEAGKAREKGADVGNIHEKHRERVRRAYIERGDLSGMHEHQILELILFYAIKRRDVNPLAHRLITCFGSLRGVLSASINELRGAGLSESTAVLLKLIGDVGYAMDRKEIVETVILNTNDAIDISHKLLFREQGESVAVICLDGKNRVSKVSVKNDGMADQVMALPKWIVDAALSSDAAALILAHNHPSGALEPSQMDKQTTAMLEKLLSPLGIALHDHIIVTREACYSMKRDYIKRMDGESASDEALNEFAFDAG